MSVIREVIRYPVERNELNQNIVTRQVIQYRFIGGPLGIAIFEAIEESENPSGANPFLTQSVLITHEEKDVDVHGVCEGKIVGTFEVATLTGKTMSGLVNTFADLPADSLSEDAYNELTERDTVTAPGIPNGVALFFDTGEFSIPNPGTGWHQIDIPNLTDDLIPAVSLDVLSGTLFLRNVNNTGRPWTVDLRPLGNTVGFEPVISEMEMNPLWWPVQFSTGNNGIVEICIHDDGVGYPLMTELLVRFLIKWHTREGY